MIISRDEPITLIEFVKKKIEDHQKRPTKHPIAYYIMSIYDDNDGFCVDTFDEVDVLNFPNEFKNRFYNDAIVCRFEQATIKGECRYYLWVDKYGG